MNNVFIPSFLIVLISETSSLLYNMRFNIILSLIIYGFYNLIFKLFSINYFFDNSSIY
jgi:hypothetical protein